MSLEWLIASEHPPRVLVNGDEPFHGGGYIVEQPFALLFASLDNDGVILEGTYEELRELLTIAIAALNVRSTTDMSAPSENLDPEHET